MKNKSLQAEKLPPIIRYSEAFKRDVVAAVERGEMTKEEARRRYEIGGNSTILKWCRQYGRKGPSARRVLIMEKDGLVDPTNKRIRDLEDRARVLEQSLKEERKRTRELEHQLENEQLRSKLYDRMIDLAEKQYEIPIRKNSGAKQ